MRDPAFGAPKGALIAYPGDPLYCTLALQVYCAHRALGPQALGALAPRTGFGPLAFQGWALGPAGLGAGPFIWPWVVYYFI